MANQLVAELGLEDKGFSEGVNSAKEAVENLSKENGAANTSFKELNKQFKDARTKVRDLSTEYNSLTDTARKGEFGQKLKQQLESAKNDALKFREVLDKVQDDLDQIKGKSKGLGKGMGEGFDINKMISGTLKTAGFGKLGGMVETLGGAMGGSVTMGAAAMTAGVAAAGFAVKGLVDISSEAIQKSAEFGRSMSELSGITGVTGKALESMKEQVMAVGRETNTLFSEVSRNFALVGSALPELLKDADGMEEVSRSAILLKKAGLMGLDEATESLTNTMAQFDIKASQSSMVVDILANSAQAGSAEINQIAETLRKAGTAANQAGVDIKEANAMVQVLAAKGLKGAEAGTALRNVLQNMSTKGIDEINPKIVGVEQALTNLAKHASDATWMTEKFGQEGATAASILGGSVVRYKELRAAMDEVGTAEQMAAANTNNLASQLEIMHVKWNNFLASFDVDHSPLTGIVVEINAIIDAIDQAVHAIMDTSTAQGAIEGVATAFEVLEEAVRVATQIIGDVISTIFELSDAGGSMSSTANIITTGLKVMNEVLYAVGAAVRLICGLIKIAVKEFKEWKNNLLAGVKDIPILSTVYEMLVKIKDAINAAIDAWKRFKAWMEKDSEIAKENKESKDKRDKEKAKKDAEKAAAEEASKGIIEKLEGEVKSLKEKRNKAQTEEDIKYYNNLIKQKENELNRLTGTGKSGGKSGSGKSGSTTKTVAPDTKAEKEYADALAIIAAEKQFANKKDLEAEEDKLNALEKLRDSYIKIEKKNDIQVRRLAEINSAITRAKSSILTLQETERWADAQNNMFKDLSQSTRQLSDGFIDEKEWEQRRVNQLKDSIETLYSISSLTKEQEKALKSYIKELNQFKIDDMKKEWNEEWRKGIHNLFTELADLDDITNNRPRMNERFKNVNDRMMSKGELSQDILKTKVNVRNPQQSGDYLNNADTIKKFHELNFALEAFIKDWKDNANKMDVASGMVNVAMLKVADMLDEAGKEDLAKDVRAQAKNMIRSDADLKKWMDGNKDLANSMKELNIDFNSIVNNFKESRDEINAGAISQVVNAFKEAGKVDLASQLQRQADFMAANGGSIEEWLYNNQAMTRAMAEVNVDFRKIVDKIKTDSDTMIRTAIRNLADKFESIGKSDFAKELRNLANDTSKSAEEIQKTINENEGNVKQMQELGVALDDIIQKIKDSGDEMAAAIVAVAKELFNQSQAAPPSKKGDRSNFDLDRKSYEKIQRELDLKLNTIGLDKWEKLDDTLDRDLAKFRDLEQKLIDIREASDKLPGGIDGVTATIQYKSAIDEMNKLEKNIETTSNKIQKHLKFEARMEGFQNIVNALQDVASIGNLVLQFQNLDETVKNCKSGFEEFMVYLNLFISTMQTVQAVIELVNFFTNLFTAGQVAATTTTGAKTKADAIAASEEAATIPEKAALTAANKTLEKSVLDLAAAQIFLAHASIPFIGVSTATGLIAEMMAAQATQHAASLSLTALAEGGIVGGPQATFNGDTTLIRANKGEMVLNTRQQANLFDLLDKGLGREGFGGNVNFKIQGDALVGCLKNTDKIKSRTGHKLKL